MARPTTLEMLDVPLPADLAALESTPLCALFALGIVNPYGPTLHVVASVGPWAAGARTAVVHLALNPFQQQAEQVGWLAMGDEWQPLELFAPLFALDFGVCPSLVLLNSAIAEHEREAFAFELLSRRLDEAALRMASVERYFGQPYERVGWELQGGHALAEAVPGAEAFAWLAKLLIDPRHAYPELGAFLYAWRGAVEETTRTVAERDAAYSHERFTRFFSERIAALLALPEKPAADAPAERAAAHAPSRYQPESIAALDDLLARETWRAMPPDQQHDVLKAALLAYGMGLDTRYLAAIGTLYSHLTDTQPEAGNRLQVVRELSQAREALPLQAETFLPFLAFDSDRGIAVAATAAYVAIGRALAYEGLATLLDQQAAANPGAIVGTLEVIAEDAEQPRVARWRAGLSAEGMKEADLARQLAGRG